MQPPTGKACKDCGELKPWCEFNKSRNRDGHCALCKTCQYARNHALRKKKQARVGTDHIPPTKQCAKCGSVKSAAEFAIYRAANDGLGRYCRECDNANSRSRRYGIPEDRVRVMASRKQCEICGYEFATSRHQHFDHRHADGAVRGVVCFRCNGIIGDCLENPGVLRAVARYLDRTLDTDYRFQPYSVTDLKEPDISQVGAPRALTPEEKATCPTNQSSP